jgi:hypothetical protein
MKLSQGNEHLLDDETNGLFLVLILQRIGAQPIYYSGFYCLYFLKFYYRNTRVFTFKSSNN